MLPDIAHAPRILPNYTQNIPANLKKVRAMCVYWILKDYVLLTVQDLDNYIRTRAPVSFLSELRGHLQVCVCVCVSVSVCLCACVDSDSYFVNSTAVFVCE